MNITGKHTICLMSFKNDYDHINDFKLNAVKIDI